MSTQINVKSRRRSRWFSLGAAAALLAAAALGIAALRSNTVHAVHAVHAAVAVPGLASGPAGPPHATSASVLPGAWQAPASDASVPSAQEVFKGRATADSDGSAATF